MPEPVYINNLAQLNEALEKLGPVPEGHQRLYRGQNGHFGDKMIPSLYREKVTYNIDDHAWKMAGNKLVKRFILGQGVQVGSRVNAPQEDLPIEGLIQHYGLRSGGLDATDELSVALWFGFSKHRKEFLAEDITDQQGKTRKVRFQNAYYEPLNAEHAYLYVLDCPLWQGTAFPRPGDCVNLRQWFGKYTSRPVRQHAWYIYSDNYSVQMGNLINVVKICFCVPVSLLGELGPYKEAMHYFPPPPDDPVYRLLLDVVCMRNREGLYQRLLDIPLYHNNPAEFSAGTDTWQYKSRLRFDEMRHYFDAIRSRYPAMFRQLTSKYRGKSWAIAAAEQMNLVIPDWHLVLCERDKDGHVYNCKLEDVRGSFSGMQHNCLIELSTYEQVVNTGPGESKVRGAWFVQEDALFGIALHTYENDDFGGTGRSYWFEYREGAGVQYIPGQGNLESDERFMNLLKVSLTNVLRIMQTYKGIRYFPEYVPLKLVYGSRQQMF